MEAVNRLSELAVNVRSQARESYRAYRSSYDIAMRYRREVLPLRKIIADEAMLRYGAMQIDVFCAAHRGAPAHCRQYRGDRSATGLLARKQRTRRRARRRRCCDRRERRPHPDPAIAGQNE